MSDLAPEEAVMQDQDPINIVQQEEDKAKVAEQSTSAGNDARAILDDAINQIIAEDTVDYKDFLFPSIKLDILFDRMQYEIKVRINKLGAKGVCVKDIVKAYRSHHSKPDDIKFLTNLFHEMEVQAERGKIPI